MHPRTRFSAIAGRLSAALAIVTLIACTSPGTQGLTALPVDLMALDPPAVPVTGFRPVERAAGVSFRWLLGPAATVALTLDKPERLAVSFDASTPLEGQTVSLVAGGREVARFEDIPAAPRLTGFTRREAVLDLPAGRTVLELRVSRYNHRAVGETFAPEDRDALALMVSRFVILPASS